MTISVEKITKTTRPKKVFHMRKMTLVIIIFCRSYIKFTRQKNMKNKNHLPHNPNNSKNKTPPGKLVMVIFCRSCIKIHPAKN